MALALPDALRAWLTRPDAMLLDVGARGERVLALCRLKVALLLFIWPLGCALNGVPVRKTTIAFAVAFAFLAASVLVAMRTRRSRRLRRVPFVSTALDVGIVAVLVALMTVDDAAAGLNSTAAWAGYAIAIVATAWRADARTTLLAGTLAVACSLGMLLGAWALHGAQGFVSLDHGQVTAIDQTLRIVALVAIALLVVMALQTARRLIEISGSDTLTQLPNRTWLLQRMPQLLDTVQNDGGALTLALVDIDHLKQFNLEHGHQGGDRALRALAAALRAHADAGDWVVRLAGGEFLLLLRQPVGTTWERLDALRRLVAERSIEGERGQAPLRITFSAGLAGFPHDGRDLSRLMRCADNRLQAARNEGRNRVVARD